MPDWRALVGADTPERRTAVWLVVVGLAAALCALPHVNEVRHLGLGPTLRAMFDNTVYNRVVIFPDYGQHGFVRRGLSGTIAGLFSPVPQTRFLVFLALSFATVVIPLALLAVRLSRVVTLPTLAFLLAVLLLSPQTFIGWAFDLGRTDLLAAGFIAWAVCASVWQRRGLAVAFVLAGLLVHETAFIFGAPLLVVMAWQDGRSGAVSSWRGPVGLAIVLLVGAAAIVGLQAVLSVTPDELAASMRTGFPAREGAVIDRDLAIYMAVGGSRALATAVCHNFELNPKWLVTALLALAVLGAYLVVLPLWRRPIAFVLAAVVPLVFMLLIANDVGRWLKFAVLNAWLLTAFLALRGDAFRRLSPLAIGVGTAVLIALASMGYTPFSDVNHFTRWRIVAWGYRYDVTLEQWLDHCDARWREVVYGR